MTFDLTLGFVLIDIPFSVIHEVDYCLSGAVELNLRVFKLHRVFKLLTRRERICKCLAFYTLRLGDIGATSLKVTRFANSFNVVCGHHY
jgi:hypothetical protein